jgi:hypothetical protein
MLRAFDQTMYQSVHIVRRLRARTMRLPREQPSEFLLIHTLKIGTLDAQLQLSITSHITRNVLIKSYLFA